MHVNKDNAVYIRESNGNTYDNVHIYIIYLYVINQANTHVGQWGAHVTAAVYGCLI